jgi:3-deoxy-D-manno-octulosonate 8-phosphate phosphatase (KDO 8-P phosphatase)
MSKLNKKILARVRAIKALVFDVDGVLTPGDILVHPDGSESKRFDVRDGIAFRLAQRAGLKICLLSGRQSEAVAQRALDLSVDICVQGSQAKKPDFLEILEKLQLGPQEAAYVGDDVVDLPVLRAAGFAASVADGCPEARSAAHYVTTARGGHGAAREVIELILKAQGHWDEIIRPYVQD